MDESRLRVGGWVEHQPDPSRAPTSGAGWTPELRSIDPMGDLTGELPPFDEGQDGDGDDGYRGRRRQREPGTAGPRRLALVAVGVGVLLVGSGLLSQSIFTGDPDGMAGPPPTPEHTRAAPTEGTGHLGVAPTRPDASPQPHQPAPEGQDDGPTQPGEDPPPPPPVLVASYEAEAAELGSHASVESMEGASGGQVVRLGGGPGGYVEFTDVTVDETGRYELTVLYVAEPDRDRSVQVSVNDGSPTRLTLPAGSGIKAASMEVDLNAGTNTIRISTTGGPPVLLDGIVID